MVSVFLFVAPPAPSLPLLAWTCNGASAGRSAGPQRTHTSIHPTPGDKRDSASLCALEMAAALVEFLSIVTFDGFGHVEDTHLDRQRDLAGG